MESEKCPSCHDGILVSVEEEPERKTKHFSCGHKFHAVTLSEKVTVKESISLEKRLGPHSIEPVSHTKSHNTDVLVVSMQQEMYKDALYFFREANRIHNAVGGVFEIWRNIRAAILFSFASIEACVNQFIDSHIEQSKNQMSADDVDYWSERKGYVSIAKKLNEGVQLFGKQGSRLDSDKQVWEEFEKLKQLRDELVHYKTENRLFYNTKELMNRSEKGICTASTIMKRIYLAHPRNVAYPTVFDTIP